MFCHRKNEKGEKTYTLENIFKEISFRIGDVFIVEVCFQSSSFSYFNIHVNTRYHFEKKMTWKYVVRNSGLLPLEKKFIHLMVFGAQDRVRET